MNRNLLIAAAIASLAAAPALAQGRGGGMGRGMGAGPPMMPPGRAGGGFDTSGSARGIAGEQGSFGRDFARQQRMTAQQYRQRAQDRRADALAYSQSVRSGAPVPDNASGKIRSALKGDIRDWRDEFQVGRKDWMQVRDQWLVDRESLTPRQWAQRRVDWFQFRDAWIARQKSWAKARNGK